MATYQLHSSQVLPSHASVQSRVIYLHRSELPEVPPPYRTRILSDNKYFWTLFVSPFRPLTLRGVQGDVWLVTAPGEEDVYIRGPGPRASDAWRPWRRHRYLTVGADTRSEVPREWRRMDCYRPWDADTRSFHPFFERRWLQFDGVGVSWGGHTGHARHSEEWAAKIKGGLNAPEYESLSVRWIARYMLGRAEPDRDRERLRLGCVVPSSPSSSYTAATTASLRTPSPPPYTAPEVQCWNAETVVVKLERETPPPTLQGKRPRAESVSAGPPSKKIKEEVEDDPAILLACPTESSQTSETIKQEVVEDSKAFLACAPDVPTTMSTADSRLPASPPQPTDTLKIYLASLPLPLDHHAQLLSTLGITHFVHLKSLATTPAPRLNELFHYLQCSGVRFMEALVLRDSLACLR